MWAFIGDGETRRAGDAGLADAGGAGEPRQPDLGGELQPAAAGRPGARQREDHPGAGSGVPGRGLERHQGDLGLGLGQAAGRGQERPAAQADGGGGGRRLPEVFRRAGQLHAAAFLRQVSRAAGAGEPPDRRADSQAAARRPRLAQGLCGLQSRRGTQGPADGDPGQDRQGLRAGRSGRRPQHHAPAEEAQRKGAARVPGALRHPGQRRGNRRDAVLPSGAGQPRDEVSAGLAPEARRVPAATHRDRQAAGGAEAGGVRRPAQGCGAHGDVHDDGLRAAAGAAHSQQDHRPPDRADHPRRGAHLRPGRAVPRDRHLFVQGPALRAGGQQVAALLQRDEGRADSRRGHHRGGFDGVVCGGGHVLRDARPATWCPFTSITRCSASSASGT